jgi:hypothetical protein
VNLTTAAAEPIDLKDMGGNPATGALGNISGHTIQAALFKILDPPACFADKVMMVFLIGTQEIVLLTVRQEDPGDHTSIGQFVKDAIDRGKADTAQPWFDAIPYLVDRQV